MQPNKKFTYPLVRSLNLGLLALLATACSGSEMDTIDNQDEMPPGDVEPGDPPPDEEEPPMTCLNVGCGDKGSCNEETLDCDCEVGYEGLGCSLAPPPQSSLVLWLDASDPTGTGTAPVPGTLSTWTDKAQGMSFSSEVDMEPSMDFDGDVPIVAFDGSNDYMTAIDFDGLSAAERYTIVVIAAASAPTQAILAGVHPEEGHALLVESEDEGAVRFVHRPSYGPVGGNDHSSEAGTFGPGLDAFLIEMNSADLEVKIMTVGEAPLVVNTDIAPFPDKPFDLVLGKLSLTQHWRYLSGGISEILVYDDTLDDEGLNRLSVYLMYKYPQLLP